MNALEFALILLFVLFFALLYARSYQLERFHVRNRGVFQPGGVTALKALRHWLRTILTYFLPFYLVVSGYFYLATRHDCRRDPVTRSHYNNESLIDRGLSAFAWPARLDEGPTCPYD